MINRIHSTVIINEPAKLGENVEISEYAIIGSTAVTFRGFKRLESTFGVEIGDMVYIGNHTSIVRGTIRPTKIGSRVVIGHYSTIGHDSIIGDLVKIINAFICGFVEVGDSTFIGPGVTIRNRIKIGRNCLIGMGSNVVKDIPDNVVAYGNPCVVKERRDSIVKDLLKHAIEQFF